MTTLKSFTLTSLHAPRPPQQSGADHIDSAWLEVADRERLNGLVPDWDDLAAHATEPNPFYESWNLAPALEMLESASVKVIVIWRRGASASAPPQMCGLLPIETTLTFHGLPVRAARTWHHMYCFHCLPLLRAGSELLALRTLFAWLDTEQIGVLELPLTHASGTFSRALAAAAEQAGLQMCIPDRVHRAAIDVVPEIDGATYLATTLSGKARQEWQRQRRRLAELGRLDARGLTSDDDVQKWVGWFLNLEASGWKGREQTALASHVDTGRFFSRVARGGFSRGQVRMFGLFLDSRPIAMKCDFLSGSGGFGFKMAFDEHYAKYSPGAQLEMDNIANLHGQHRVQWVDSCMEPNHGAISRMWNSRRTMQRVLISSGSPMGDLAVSSIPLVRSVRRLLRGRRR